MNTPLRKRSRKDISGAHLGGRDPVDRAAQPGVERHALRRLEQQRIQVEHAELAVADPRLALADPLERADVHERRARALELDVVGRRVLQHHVVLERRQQQVELQQRGVLQHREGPLVRVRDERDALVAQDRGGLVHEQALQGGRARRRAPCARRARRRAGRWPRAPRSRSGRRPRGRGRRRRPRRRRGSRDRGRSPARGRRAPTRWHRRNSRLGGVCAARGVRALGSAVSGSSLRMRRKRRMRFQYSLAVTATAARPPAMICRIMLPLPGSRYARTVVMVWSGSVRLGIARAAQASRANACESCERLACAYAGPTTTLPAHMKLIIQIPCFNEEATLPGTLADLPREVEGIDDGRMARHRRRLDRPHGRGRARERRATTSCGSRTTRDSPRPSRRGSTPR